MTNDGSISHNLSLVDGPSTPDVNPGDSTTLKLGELEAGTYGFPQLAYAKDGYPLDEPFWVDTLNVAPGERYSILVHATEAGAWVWHCHILNHFDTEEGMFGMVNAVIVEP